MNIVMKVALGVLPLLCCNVSADQPPCSNNNVPQHQPYYGWHPLTNSNPNTQDHHQQQQQPYLIMILMPNNNTSGLVPLSQTLLENIWGSMHTSPATTSTPQTTVPSTTRRQRFRTRTRQTFTTPSLPQTSTNPHPLSSTTRNSASPYPENSTISDSRTSTSPHPSSLPPSNTDTTERSDHRTSTTTSAGDNQPNSTSSHQEYSTSNPEALSTDYQPSALPTSSSPSPTSPLSNSTRSYQHLRTSTVEHADTEYEELNSSPSTLSDTTVDQRSSTTNYDVNTGTVLQRSRSRSSSPSESSSDSEEESSTDTEYWSKSVEYDNKYESNSKDCDSDDDPEDCTTEEPSDLGGFSYVEAKHSESQNIRTSRPLATTITDSETYVTTEDTETTNVVTSSPTAASVTHNTTQSAGTSVDNGHVDTSTLPPATTSGQHDPISTTAAAPTTTPGHNDPVNTSTAPPTTASSRHYPVSTTTAVPATTSGHNDAVNTSRAPPTTTSSRHHPVSTTTAVPATTPGHNDAVNTSRAPPTTTSGRHDPVTTSPLPPTTTPGHHHHYHTNTSTTTPRNISFWPCFGPAPGNSSYQTVSEMVRNNGYHSEAHLLRTADNYLLCLHRVAQTPRSSNPRPVVLLQHGIPGSSADWIIAGRNRGLAYLLADAGYDVWMSNSRGNNYSLGHEYLDTHSDKYWSFSLDEMAMYDIPAVLDHILHHTHQSSLYVVTQSTGSAILLAMLASRPCYNHNIRAAYHLAPAVYLANNTNFLSMSNQPRTGRFNATPELLSQFGVHLCLSHRDVVPEAICRNFRFLVGGYSHCNISKEVLAALLSHSFAGTSEKSYLHYSQILASGKFRQFDYGPLSNLIVYSRKTPPEYDLSLVTAPSSVFYSELDPVVGHREVNWLVQKLPNIVEVRHVPYFTHWDFLWGPRARLEVYNHILQEMKQLNQTWWLYNIPPNCAPLSRR